MRLFAHVILALVLATSVTACGTKGKLKTPTQAAADAEKKARKKAEKEQAAEAEKVNAAAPATEPE